MAAASRSAARRTSSRFMPQDYELQQQVGMRHRRRAMHAAEAFLSVTFLQQEVLHVRDGGSWVDAATIRAVADT